MLSWSRTSTNGTEPSYGNRLAAEQPERNRLSVFYKKYRVQRNELPHPIFFYMEKIFLSVRDKKAPRDYMAHDHSSYSSTSLSSDRSE